MCAYKNKRIIRPFILTLSVLLLMLSGFITVRAEEGETLPPEYSDFISSLENEITDRLPDGLFSDDAEKISEGASELADPALIIKLIVDAFGQGMVNIIPTFVTILCIIMISALILSVARSASSSVTSTVTCCVKLVSFCAISGSVLNVVETVGDYFDMLFSSVASFLPLSAVLYAMGGNLSAASGSTVTMNVILSLCQFFFTKTAIPVFSLSLCFSLLPALDAQSSYAVNTIGATLRKWYMTALSFVMMTVTATVGAQSLLSAKADSAAMRGMRFAASSFIPITGGTVSSTLGTLAAGVNLLRGSVGVIGIFVILLMLVPTVVELAVFRLALAAGGFFASLAGCNAEAAFLKETDSLIGCLEGIAALAAAVFVISFAIFACVSCPM